MKFYLKDHRAAFTITQMSFMHLVNGKGSDLIPPKDANPEIQTAVGVAGAVIAAAVTAAQVIYSPGGGLSALGRGVIAGSGSLAGISERKQQVIAQNALRAEQRRSLGCRYLENILAQQPESADLLCRVARARFADRYPNGALIAALRAVELDHNHVEANLLAAYYLLHSRRTAEALLILEKDLAPTEREGFLLNGIGDLLEKRGLTPRAVEFWTLAVTLNDRDSRAWCKLAVHHEAHAEFGKAKHCYIAASRSDEDIRLPWKVAYEQGHLALAEGRIVDARTLFEHSLKFEVDWPDPIIGKALCAIREANISEALALLSEALKLDPNHAQAHLIMGNLYEGRQESHLAIQHWSSAFAADPEAPVPWVIEFRKGRVCFDERRWEDAISHFSAAEKLHCWLELNDMLQQSRRKLNGERSAQWGNHHWANGDKDKAESEWKKAIDFDHTLAEPYLKIGALRVDAGYTAEALELFTEAHRLGHPLAKAALDLCRAYHEFCPEIGPN